MQRQSPVLVVIEDAHWIDPSTTEHVGQMLTEMASQRLFVLLTARPELERHTVGLGDQLRHHGCRQIIGRDTTYHRFGRCRADHSQRSKNVLLAGIGKSRLLQTLRMQLRETLHTEIVFYCSPQHQNSALWPVIQQLHRALGSRSNLGFAGARTALAAAKKRGKKLGGNRGVRPTAEMRARSTAVLKQRAATRAADIAPTIKGLLEGGATSLRAIAEGLNARGIPTAGGQGTWSAVQVARILERI